MLQVITQAAPSEVRRMYHRVLAGWARDALSLRRRGLDRPTARGALGVFPIGPGRAEPAEHTPIADADPVRSREGRAPRGAR